MATYIAKNVEGEQVNLVEIEPEQIPSWEALTGLTLAQTRAVAAEKTMEARMQAVEQAVEGFGVMETTLNVLGVQTRWEE